MKHLSYNLYNEMMSDNYAESAQSTQDLWFDLGNQIWIQGH
jgi:hypothetical protein